MLKEIYWSWERAGVIVTVIFALVALVGGFTSFFVELLMDAACGLIPFPFDLLFSWSLNPIPVILQGILAVILLYYSH